MKKFLIIANWKLHGSIKIISDFLEFLKLNISIYLKKNIVVIAPPTIYLERVKKYISDMNVFLCSQNVDINLKGAFTGETSILMLQDIGVKYVIVGHSERRLFHNETNHIVAKKFCLIKKSNLIPILCIGETEYDKNNGQTKKIITEQLDCIFKSFGETAFRNAVIAYEPLWAIGTGVSADPKSVQYIHKFIKNYVAQHDLISMKNITILYGGSVNYSNAKEFIKQPDINGLLIGSASLYSSEFLKIIEVAYYIA